MKDFLAGACANWGSGYYMAQGGESFHLSRVALAQLCIAHTLQTPSAFFEAPTEDESRFNKVSVKNSANTGNAKPLGVG